MTLKDLNRLSVDGVLCISLRERQDRRDLITKEFAGSGLTIEFLLVDLDKENPERGCFDSHIKCATIALSRNYKNILILEDDATFIGLPQKQLTQISNFLVKKNPELFYLGATLGKLWLTWSSGIARYRTKGAFAYILSSEGCSKVVNFSPYSGRAIDQIFSKNFKAYGAFPLVCQHQPECTGKSNLMQYRKSKDVAPPKDNGQDEEFWKRNWKRQYTQAIKNIGKTLAFRDL
ncbi:MAG: glycosyltransferase family 25 protein [Pseudomonas sp.]|uniref:glycosyltransferase family 25 protein n=1 Tax=Pseudomonas sp. TaxID=306 RepID=UPI00391E0491